MIVFGAFRFPSPDNTPAGEGATCLGDDRSLHRVMARQVAENDHPVFDTYQFMGARGVEWDGLKRLGAIFGR